MKKEREGKTHIQWINSERQKYIAVLGFLLVMLPFLSLYLQLIKSIYSQTDIMVSQRSQVCYAYSEFSQPSREKTQGYMCSCKQAGGLVVEELRAYRVNPTPTIMRAPCHVKVCTKLNGY